MSRDPGGDTFRVPRARRRPLTRGDEEVSQLILAALRQESPRTALGLATSLLDDYASKPYVNKLLYRMEERGAVRRVEGKPPLWYPS